MRWGYVTFTCTPSAFLEGVLLGNCLCFVRGRCRRVTTVIMPSL